MSLEALWFVLAACAFAAFVVLDGFDLGAGILSRVAGRTPAERAAIARSIGPVWDGNEVWLLAAGGTLYFAFPKLYASAIAGFYLPVIVLVWLLTFRALGIEMKHQLHHPLWDELWDAAFFASSLLVTLFLGVALGNVVRGVSLEPSGAFFAPLWTDFGTSGKVGILDYYTVAVGLTAVAGVALHGAHWIADRVAGPPGERALRAARVLGPAAIGLFAASGALTFAVRPEALSRTAQQPWLGALPLLTIACAGWSVLQARAGEARRAFFGSAGFLACAVLTAAATLFPYVLPGRDGGGLLASDAKTSDYGLRVGLAWWLPGLALATSYFVFVYRRLPAKVSAEDDAHDPAAAAAADEHEP